MKIVDCDEKKCILCSICSSNCPTNALFVDKELRTWKIEADLCMSCGLCVSQCPRECISFIESNVKEIVRNVPVPKPTKRKAKKL